MRPHDARRAAAIELGGLEAVKERVRDVKAGATVDSLVQDVRYATRTLRRAPMFALTATLSLGIGIAGNAVVFSLAEYRTIGESPTPFFYVPAAQRYEPIMWILMRPSRPSLGPQVRTVIREMDPHLPVVQAGTLAKMTAFTLFPLRVAASLAALVGAIGVFRAALGVYGIAAYNASLRTREIGIRVALGAVRAQVLRLILGQAGRLAAAGIVFGLSAAVLATRLLEGLLYGVRPLDSVSFAGGAIVFVALALIVSLIPARRAASVNPVEALRTQ
jgi:hypothetical protein